MEGIRMAVFGAKELRVHESLDELGTDLADYIADISESSVNERGFFSLALSGGSLIDLLGKLSEGPYNKTVDWAKWYIFLADERVVAKNHSDSNYKLVKDRLFSKVPIVPSHLISMNDAVSGEEAASEYEFTIRQVVKSRVVCASGVRDCPEFDLVVMGVGPDGSVGSLFPAHSALDEEGEWVTFITDSPEPPPERITFTLPVLNSASNVALVAVGTARAEAARVALRHPGPASPVPAGMVRPASGNLVWFLDKPAASKLAPCE